MSRIEDDINNMIITLLDCLLDARKIDKSYYSAESEAIKLRKTMQHLKHKAQLVREDVQAVKNDRKPEGHNKTCKHDFVSPGKWYIMNLSNLKACRKCLINEEKPK